MKYFKRFRYLKYALIILVCLLSGSTLYASSQPASGDFTYKEESTGVTITSYTGADTEVTIPSVISDKEVTAIGDYAFMLCNTVEKVNVPSSVKNIASTAFMGATNLKKVVLASEDTVIEEKNETAGTAQSGTDSDTKQDSTSDYEVIVDKSADDKSGNAKNDVTEDNTVKHNTVNSNDAVNEDNNNAVIDNSKEESVKESEKESGVPDNIAGIDDGINNTSEKVSESQAESSGITGKINLPAIIITGILIVFIIIVIIISANSNKKKK